MPNRRLLTAARRFDDAFTLTDGGGDPFLAARLAAASYLPLGCGRGGVGVGCCLNRLESWLFIVLITLIRSSWLRGVFHDAFCFFSHDTKFTDGRFCKENLRIFIRSLADF